VGNVASFVIVAAYILNLRFCLLSFGYDNMWRVSVVHRATISMEIGLERIS
jgi:hypothetical protein